MIEDRSSNTQRVIRPNRDCDDGRIEFSEHKALYGKKIGWPICT